MSCINDFQIIVPALSQVGQLQEELLEKKWRNFSLERVTTMQQDAVESSSFMLLNNA